MCVVLSIIIIKFVCFLSHLYLAPLQNYGVLQNILTISTLWANAADDKLMIFFLFFLENGSDTKESNPIFWKKIKRIS